MRSAIALSFGLFIAVNGVPHARTIMAKGNWGLDRIDQRSGTDGVYHYTATGAGVNIYVIDTGVRADHADFGGRAHPVGEFCTGSPGSGDANDYESGLGGHGTHVASLAAGATYGVASGAAIYALRVGQGAGCTDDLAATIRAVNWVTAQKKAPAVVNISLAFPSNSTLNQAILESIAAGYIYTLSAGSAAADGRAVSNFWSEEVANAAIVAAATDISDRPAYSHYGPSLGLFAPGVKTTAAGNASATAVYTGSGDSYAAPLAAGVAALYLEHHPAAQPAEVRAAILSGATVVNGLPQRLLYSLLAQRYQRR